MKFPYVMGERSPGRASQEYAMKCSDPSFSIDTFYNFSVYLDRYYPSVYKRLNCTWFIECFILDWPTKQSPFVIAICDLRNGTVLAMYPTFKKAARALVSIFNAVKFEIESNS